MNAAVMTMGINLTDHWFMVLSMRSVRVMAEARVPGEVVDGRGMDEALRDDDSAAKTNLLLAAPLPRSGGSQPHCASQSSTRLTLLSNNCNLFIPA